MRRGEREKTAAGLRVYQRRNLAAQCKGRIILLNDGIRLQDRRQQALRVRMTTILEQRFGGCHLGDTLPIGCHTTSNPTGE